MKISYPGMNDSISGWKGQEITDFQEELRMKVNANISEKWFYTHMKSDHATLPRIDMLNILSRYAGFANWDDFIHKNSIPEEIQKKKAGANRYFILVPALSIVVIALFFVFFLLFNTQSYRFTILDEDTHEPIVDQKTEIQVLSEGESPVRSIPGKDGSFQLRTDKSRIRLVVSSPYYQTDTITRTVTKLQREELILLRPDNYAMMVHYYSTMKVDDWQKRRSRLNEMISDSAVICQVMSDRSGNGMDLLNKQELIDRLSVPSSSLKNIEILGSRSKGGKIILLKFRVRENRK